MSENTSGFPADTATPVEEHHFPCDRCGADFRFDANRSMLVCDHCGNSARVEPSGPWAATIAELDYRHALENRLPAREMEVTRVSSCPSCGAQVEFKPSVHAAECPFCASPVVTDTGTHRHIKPGALLTFALDETAARAAMKDWLGSLWFAPNGLQDYARKGRRMQGIYVPYWTFDAQTNSAYTGQRGTVYYENRTVMRNGKRQNTRVRRVRWRGVSGRVARFFDDVLVLASRSLPHKYTSALEPWDLSALEPYQPEFLAGFRAEGYTVTLEEGFTQARQQMDAVIARDVRADIGGDEQRISRIDTRVSDVTFKHILLPVWLAAYKFRGETYRFVVNGRTGRVQGERPYSTVKIAIAVILALLAAAALGYVLVMQEGL